MSASPVILLQKPILANADTLYHTANNLRRVTDTIAGVGVLDLNSWRVRQRVAGAAMSVDVTDAATSSQAYVRGSSTNLQGLYLLCNTAQGTGTIDAIYNVDISTADPTNPRIDQVYLCVEDAQHAGSNNQATIRVVTGTPTGGATLDNRTGVGAAPAGMASILLADILVAAAVGSILTAAIRDRRPIGNFGSVPWLGSTGTQVDMVAFQPHPALPLTIGPSGAGSGLNITATTNDNQQAAVLMWLPRRIVSATRIRWKFQQGGTAAATGYTIGIYDVSGRIITSTTGPPVFSGALNTSLEVSAAIGTTTYEAGWYYVLFGVAAMTAASVVYYTGVPTAVVNAQTDIGGAYRNLSFRSATGGSGPPTTLLAFTDTVTLTAATASPPVPIIALSVG